MYIADAKRLTMAGAVDAGGHLLLLERMDGGWPIMAGDPGCCRRGAAIARLMQQIGLKK